MLGLFSLPFREDIWFDDVDPEDIEVTLGPEAANIARKRLGQSKSSVTLVKEQAFGGYAGLGRWLHSALQGALFRKKLLPPQVNWVPCWVPGCTEVVLWGAAWWVGALGAAGWARSTPYTGTFGSPAA